MKFRKHIITLTCHHFNFLLLSTAIALNRVYVKVAWNLRKKNIITYLVFRTSRYRISKLSSRQVHPTSIIVGEYSYSSLFIKKWHLAVTNMATLHNPLKTRQYRKTLWIHKCRNQFSNEHQLINAHSSADMTNFTKRCFWFRSMNWWLQRSILYCL